MPNPSYQQHAATHTTNLTTHTTHTHIDTNRHKETHTHTHTHIWLLLGPKGPSKIQEVTLMRPIHGNL